MKKKGLFLIIALLLTGCGSKKMICQLNKVNDSQNYQVNSKFIIDYKNNYALKIDGYEKYKSSDSNVIDYYGDYLERTYIDLKNNYHQVTYNKQINNNEVVFHSTMVLDEDVVKKMKKNKYIESDYIKNNHITITGFKNYYEDKGYECK